jgi:hypothetical protein
MTHTHCATTATTRVTTAASSQEADRED